MLVDAAEASPDQVERLLNIARRVPGQKSTWPRMTAELQAKDLLQMGLLDRWDAVVDLEGRWFPPPASVGASLSHFREVAGHAYSAQGKLSASERLKSWRKALDLLSKNVPATARNDFVDAAFAKYHGDVVASRWRGLVEKEVAAAKVEADKLLPNPFHYTGNPLSPREEDKAIFLGREAVFADLQRALTEPLTALGILGPRRVGKSSLLRRLSVELPGDVFVYFDLQDNPVNDPASFYAALERRFDEALVGIPDGGSLPRLAGGSSVEAVSAWFEALEQALTQRLVFCFDEYERLESLWPGDRRSLLQFLGLMRATLQHKQRVRVLIAGVAAPEDLGKLWTDHFISVHEVRLDFLTEAQTLTLLCQDKPGFPGPAALTEEIGRQIHTLTAGQPHLTQLFGFLLVERLNSEFRRVATLEDVEATRREMPSKANNYFADERLACEEHSPETAAILVALAKEEQPLLQGPVRRWLRMRGVANESGSLRVPLFKDYLRRRLAEEGLL